MKQAPFEELIDVVVPDLGTHGAPIEFVTWLVPVQANVICGERIAELLVRGILFHLEAPVGGTLSMLRVAPGTVVSEGDVLAQIQHDDVATSE